MGALDRKVAIVTGGTSGIGRRIVEVFAEEGAKVVVAARREDEGGALEKLPGVRFLRTDVSIEADVKATVDRRMVRARRLPDQQRRHCDADVQHHRDRRRDPRSGVRRQCPRRAALHQAHGARDAVAGRPQHRQRQQHVRPPRRSFLQYLHGVERRGARAHPLGRRRARREGDTREQHLPGRDRDRHVRQSRRDRGPRGRPSGKQNG